MDINMFADMTPYEFSKKLGLDVPQDGNRIKHTKSVINSVPAALDWREKNVVNTVKD